MSTHPASGPTARTPAQVLLQARQKASQAKRSAVTQALTTMLAQGQTVTFARVAQQAGVSTWLVYSPGMREQVQTAIDHQQQPNDTPRRHSPSVDSLRTDLALARQQIHQLRHERDELRARLSQTLGHQLTSLATAPLVERLNAMTGELAQARAANTALTAQVATLDEDLIAARTSLRRMIHHQNTTADQ